MVKEIKEQLCHLEDQDFKKFNQNLLPGVKNIIGIRMPVLRKLAQKLAKEDFRTYLSEAEQMITGDSAHEEIMMQGLVIGYAKMTIEERMQYLDEFIPKIQNWAVCDSCCMGYKFMRKDKATWFSYLEKYWKSREEFEIRFAVVSMLVHFTDEEYIGRLLEIFNYIHHTGYYAKMAVAWAVSVCYIKFPEETRKFLLNNDMDDFTHNKAIQKIQESYRVERKEKEELKQLKR